MIHRSKTRNNALDVFWGIETIIMPLSRQPQKKSFCPVSHSLAPTFMKIFFIMRLPCRGLENCTCKVEINLISLKVQGYGAVAKQATGLNERSEVREAAEGYRAA